MTRPQPKGVAVIIIGLICLLIAWLLAIPPLWTIGIILIVVGLILALLGRFGHPVYGHRHYY